VTYLVSGMLNVPSVILKKKDYDEMLSIVNAANTPHPELEFGAYVGWISIAGVFFCYLKQPSI